MAFTPQCWTTGQTLIQNVPIPKIPKNPGIWDMGFVLLKKYLKNKTAEILKNETELSMELGSDSISLTVTQSLRQMGWASLELGEVQAK